MLQRVVATLLMLLDSRCSIGSTPFALIRIKSVDGELLLRMFWVVCKAKMQKPNRPLETLVVRAAEAASAVQ
jgi:hypothetical protein